MDPEERNKNWHLVMPDGSDLTGGRGSAELLKHARGFGWLGRGLTRLRLWWLLSPFERLMKKLRPRLGWMVKKGPGPVRFP